MQQKLTKIFSIFFLMKVGLDTVLNFNQVDRPIQYGIRLTKAIQQNHFCQFQTDYTVP
jgi:hypothetical protein